MIDRSEWIEDMMNEIVDDKSDLYFIKDVFSDCCEELNVSEDDYCYKVSDNEIEVFNINR